MLRSGQYISHRWFNLLVTNYFILVNSQKKKVEDGYGYNYVNISWSIFRDPTFGRWWIILVFNYNIIIHSRNVNIIWDPKNLRVTAFLFPLSLSLINMYLYWLNNRRNEYTTDLERDIFQLSLCIHMSLETVDNM